VTLIDGNNSANVYQTSWNNPQNTAFRIGMYTASDSPTAVFDDWTVTMPLAVTACATAPEAFANLDLASETGCLYSLEYCTNSAFTNWLGVAEATGVASTGGLLRLSDTNVWPQVFYRVRLTY